MNLAISERILRSDISKYSKCVLVPIFFPNCVSLTKKIPTINWTQVFHIYTFYDRSDGENVFSLLVRT